MDALLLPNAAGGTGMKNPNGNSKSSSVGNSNPKPSGKKGGGMKVPVTGGKVGKTGSGYNR